MAMKTATRFSVRTDSSVFKRLGPRNQENITRNHQVKTVVCKYWLEGRCTRNPCNFLHPDLPKTDNSKSKYAWKNSNTFNLKNSPPIEKTQQKALNNKENRELNQIVLKKQQKVLTSQVNVGQSVEKTENCMKVKRCELNDGQSQSIKKTENCMNRKDSEVNVGQGQSIEKTENCMKVKRSELNDGQSQSIKKTENCMNKRNSEVNACQSQSIEKTENCMNRKNSEINVGQSQSVEKTEICMNRKNSEVNVGQRQNIEKTENFMDRKKIEVNFGQSQNIKKTENCMNGENSELNAGQSQSTENIDNGFSMVSQLEGHTKGVTGIVYDGSNKLFCGSKDKSVRVWDCNNGHCGNVVNFDNECRILVKEGPWIFVGLKDMIKAWNFETQTEVTIRACGGYVNAITMFEDILFAGMEDGSILSWKVTSKTSFSEEPTVLKGHTGSVLCFIIGAKNLYSGSADHTIRVWDCETLECRQVLSGHTGDVPAVICWKQYLFSGSLDKSIKIWGVTESGNIEQVYQHDLVNGVVGLCGMHDAEEKPLLICSCKDNGVYVYDLPSFCARGRIVSKHDIEAIQLGPEGFFITGDAAGLIRTKFSLD